MTITTYYDLLRLVHDHLRPELYLEIGVHEGHSLVFVQPGTRTIAIDPTPSVATPPPDTTIVTSTSDAFFARYDVADVLATPIDLAFVDGLHLCEQALRDILNVEQHCRPEGVILVHDCLPISEATAARDHTTMVWSGDVWRSILALRRHRPDLTITTIAADPTGVAVITGLDPAARMSAGEFDEIVAEMHAMPYSTLEKNDRNELLNVVAPEWPLVAGLLISASD